MKIINIDIDQTNNTFILKGAISELLSQRRATLYLKDYLNADLTSPNRIAIQFSTENQEEILKSIQKLLSKFGFDIQVSAQIENILSDYFLAERNFSIFSKQAYSIRNNELNDEHKKDFENFTKCLIEKLPNRGLYPLQLLAAYHLAFSQNACNFSVPGSGKTSIVYGAYAFLSNLPKDNPKHIDKLLVIGPLSSFGPWETEFKECFGREPYSKRLSGVITREEKVAHFYSSNPAELTLVSYNGTINLSEYISHFLKKYSTMVVLDEAHKIKNVYGGQIATAVLDLARSCRARVVLTGTPAPNGYEDIYNLFKFIWPTKDIINFHLFQLKEMSKHVDDPKTDDLIKNISPYFIRIRKSDLGLPKPSSHPPILVQMGNVQKEIYDYIEKNYLDYFIKEPTGSGLLAKLQSARLIRLMQVSTNPALLQKPLDEFFEEEELRNDLFIDDSAIIDKISSYNSKEVPPKFITAGSLIKRIVESGQKVIVWAIFIQNLLSFQEYLRTIGIDSRTLYGATPIEKDDQISDVETRESRIKEFHKENSSFKVIIANPSAVSESISLHKACKNAIYLERSFNAANFVQSKDRIHRYGLKPDDIVNYYYILSDNAIDATIHDRLALKERRMLEIMEKEPIPLFSRLDEDETDDIKALIDNYVRKTATTR